MHFEANSTEYAQASLIRIKIILFIRLVRPFVSISAEFSRNHSRNRKKYHRRQNHSRNQESKSREQNHRRNHSMILERKITGIEIIEGKNFAAKS